jgi:6-phosphogluconolactonase (cycloisomerase 2 family)
MPINALGTPGLLLVVAAFALALTSCGKTPAICNGGSVGTCLCTSNCPAMPGPEFLYASSTSGQVLGYSIDHNTGALTAINSISGPMRSLGLTAVNNQFLYASDPLNSQLYGYSINPTSGALTMLGASPFSTGAITFPAQLASPQNTSLLYAADAGRVDAFSVGSSGAITPVSGSPFAAATNLLLTVDPSGEFLYTPLVAPPGSIAAFTIGSGGSLAAVPGSPFTIPGQTISNSLSAGIVDTGSFVYEALSAANQIAAFSINSSTGALTPVPTSPFSTTGTPTALLSASGFLYAAIDGAVTAYSIDPSSGALTTASSSPFAIGAVAMAADSFGQYLYLAGPLGILAFSIDSSTGALTPVLGSPFPAANEVTLLTVVQIP